MPPSPSVGSQIAKWIDLVKRGQVVYATLVGAFSFAAWVSRKVGAGPVTPYLLTAAAFFSILLVVSLVAAAVRQGNRHFRRPILTIEGRGGQSATVEIVNRGHSGKVTARGRTVSTVAGPIPPRAEWYSCSVVPLHRNHQPAGLIDRDGIAHIQLSEFISGYNAVNLAVLGAFVDEGSSVTVELVVTTDPPMQAGPVVKYFEIKKVSRELQVRVREIAFER